MHFTVYCLPVYCLPLPRLLAGVEGPGYGEHDGDHEGEFGVGAVAVVEVDDGVEGPGSGADGPYPCSATHHLSLDARTAGEGTAGRRIVHFMRQFGMYAVVVGMMFGVVRPGNSQEVTAVRCAGLVGVKLEGAKVTSAELVPAGGAVAGAHVPAAAMAKVPAFCRVRVTDTPSGDSDIRTEVWLPVAGWNGKYRAQGNGGFAGVIDFEGMAAAVTQGYATSGTDTGHVDNSSITGMIEDGAKFALGHPEKVKDFGWRAVHDMTVQAKVLAKALYGKAVEKSYFTSCSDGGREALMEAQRFPGDYDGILAGAPAYNWTGLIASAAQNDKTMLASPEAYVSSDKLAAVTAAVLAQCDETDGVKDGVVGNPMMCRFDPRVLACKGAETDACLTPPQMATLKEIYAAKKDAQGREVNPGYSPGAESAPGAWGVWMMGKKPGDFTLMMYFGVGFYRDFVYANPEWGLKDFSFDRDYKAAVAKDGEALNAVDVNLKPFVARGGKLLLYHGWNDPAIPALSTVAYYDGVVGALGKTAAEKAVRLYMVPGMLHCSGGPGVVDFGEDRTEARGDAGHDVFTALEHWVEMGKEPGTLTAVKFVGGDAGKGVEASRPVCVWPKWAKYVGGDKTVAGSFACVE